MCYMVGGRGEQNKTTVKSAGYFQCILYAITVQYVEEYERAMHNICLIISEPEETSIFQKEKEIKKVGSTYSTMHYVNSIHGENLG